MGRALIKTGSIATQATDLTMAPKAALNNSKTLGMGFKKLARHNSTQPPVKLYSNYTAGLKDRYTFAATWQGLESNLGIVFKVRKPLNQFLAKWKK